MRPVSRSESPQAGRQVAGLGPGSPDDVGQDSTGFHRGELVGVADQDQPGRGAYGLQQPGGHGQRHHGHLVDDDDVVRQLVGGMVPEPPLAGRQPAQEPVQGGRAQGPEPVPVAGLELVGCGADRLLQARGRLAGGGGQRHPQRPTRLVGQQGQQPGNRGGLPGAGRPGQNRDPARGRHGGGQPLPVRSQESCVRREEPTEGRRQTFGVDEGQRGGEAVLELAADLLLLLPIAFEVEQAVRPTQRTPAGLVGAVGHQRAGPDRRDPGLDLRPGQLGDVDALLVLVEDHGVDGPQVDADRPVPQRPDRESEGQAHPVVGLLAHPGHGFGRSHVGHVQDAGAVELRQQAGGAVRDQMLLPVRRRQRGGAGVGDHGPRPSRRSDRSVTRTAGGRQAKTPAGTPST